MRSHNFNFGDDKNKFVSMNSATYQPQTADPNGKAKNEDIRKTHFTLGEQSGSYVTENQRQYYKKEGGPNGDHKTSNRLFQSTNFQFGDDANANTSTQRMDFKAYPGHQAEALNKEKLNQLRSTHFSVGQHPLVGQTVNQVTYTAKNVPYEKKNTNFQSSNFQLGDGPNMYATTYNASCAPVAAGGAVPAEKADRDHTKSNFEIGSGKFHGVTQFQSAYVPHGNAASKADKDFIAQIKDNHFSLAEEGGQGTYLTENMAQFQDKGDPSKIRSTLDENRKADLRKSHFNIGNKKGHFSTTMQTSYQPQEAQPSAFNSDKARDLKNSHFQIGEGEHMNYTTQHMINYRWVQPKEVPVQRT